VAPSGPSRLVVDDLGRQVAIPSHPARVISLAPNLTEIAFAVGAGPQLVGTTSWCNYPASASATTRVGDTQHPDLERIVALEPDLVLVSTASQVQDLTNRLEGLGIPVYVSNPRSLDEVLASIATLGDVLDRAESGRLMASALKARAAALHGRIVGLAEPRVFVMVGDQPLITAGRGTFIDDLVRRAGGDSISANVDTEWPQFSVEAVITAAPAVIVVPTGGHGMLTLPEPLKQTPAARQGRVVAIDADLLMRPGPRLVDGLEALATALHPERFE
jgi:iron complex transport system substrate-binding protein